MNALVSGGRPLLVVLTELSFRLYLGSNLSSRPMNIHFATNEANNR